MNLLRGIARLSSTPLSILAVGRVTGAVAAVASGAGRSVRTWHPGAQDPSGRPAPSEMAHQASPALPAEVCASTRAQRLAQRAVEALRAGRTGEAEAHFAAAVRLDPRRGFEAGVALYGAGQYSSALSFFARDAGPAVAARVAARRGRGRGTEWASGLAPAALLYTRCAAALVDALAKRERLDEAACVFQELAAAQPDHPALACLGKLYPEVARTAQRRAAAADEARRQAEDDVALLLYACCSDDDD